MLLKEMLKKNKFAYQLLKPFVDECRILGFSIRGGIRKMGIGVNENFKELRRYRGKFSGQRCYVIGNGPSLRADDLDKIKGKLSFGCNKIDKIFSGTEWRPSFWCVTDERVLDGTIPAIPDDIVLFTTKTAKSLSINARSRKNLLYVDDLYLKEHIVRMDMLSWWSFSATVLVFMIELAIFMGFSEIILLGVDCTYSSHNYQHFLKEYSQSAEYKEALSSEAKKIKERGMTPAEFDEHMYNMFITDYSNIKKEAGKMGVKILNATRGGRLEVYPRIAFEDCLN